VNMQKAGSGFSRITFRRSAAILGIVLVTLIVRTTAPVGAQQQPAAPAAAAAASPEAAL